MLITSVGVLPSGEGRKALLLLLRAAPDEGTVRSGGTPCKRGSSPAPVGAPSLGGRGEL